MLTEDAVRILSLRSGRPENEIKEILEGVNKLRRKAEPEFRLVRHTTMSDGAEGIYESDDGVYLAVWTPKKKNGEWGKGEFYFYLSEEGEDAVACNSWADALARRAIDPEPQQQPPPRGIHPKLIVSI